jgi:hypothetical protein
MLACTGRDEVGYADIYSYYRGIERSLDRNFLIVEQA